MIDSVFRAGDNYYPQVLLEESKCVVKEKKIPEYIIDDIKISSDDPDREDSDEDRNLKKLPQGEIWSKDTGPFLKISFFFRCFSHIFAIVIQLPGFSITRLANVENVFNVNVYFKCKFEYKRLFM